MIFVYFQETKDIDSDEQDFVEWYRARSKNILMSPGDSVRKSSKDVSTFHETSIIRNPESIRSKSKRRVMWADGPKWRPEKTAVREKQKSRHGSRRQKGRKHSFKLPPLNEHKVQNPGTRNSERGLKILIARPKYRTPS